MKFLEQMKRFSYTRVIAMGYLAVVFVGSLLLMFPACTVKGENTDYLTALFTAASATCVTGLVVVDTATHWTWLGHFFILLMIQIGGLGFMTMGVMLAMFLKRRISLRARGLLQESMNTMQMGGIIRLLKLTLKGTLWFEAGGALLLWIRFIPVFGIGKGLLMGIFHSVSAFCNAGFDLMGSYSGEYSSFTAFAGDVTINLVFSVLIICGGIGFFVWSDLKKNKLHFEKYRLHTKTALFVTALLLVGGTALFWIFEKNNLFAEMSVKEQLLAALFSSVTARTAGFNTVDTAGLSNASKLLTSLLMFIGGSPGSTAGGIKTVTVAALLAYVWSNLRVNKGVNLFNRRLSGEDIQKAGNVLVLSLLMAVTAVLFICYIQPQLPVMDVIFEVLSAVDTVGMSTGITRDLSTASRIAVILLMYCGRIGSMSFALSFTERKKAPPVQLPVEKLLIG